MAIAPFSHKVVSTVVYELSTSKTNAEKFLLHMSLFASCNHIIFNFVKDYNDNSRTMTSIGIVNKLHRDDSKHVYVGSTMLEPRRRLSLHRAKLQSGVGAISKYFKDCDFEGLQLSIIAKYMVCDHKHILAYEQLHINREKAINSNKSFKVANPEYEAQLKNVS